MPLRGTLQVNSLADNIVGFVQILRSLGVRVSVAETLDAVDGLSLIDALDRDEFRIALKCSLIKSAEDQSYFEEAFNLFFVPPEVKQRQQQAWDDKQQEDAQQSLQAEQELVFQGKPLELPEDLKNVYKKLPEEEKKRLQDFLHKTSTGHNVKGKFQPVVENLLRSSLSFWQRQLSPEDLAELAKAKRELIGMDELDQIVENAAGIGGDHRNPLLYKNMQDITEEEIPQVMALIKKLAHRLTTRITRRYRLTSRRKLIDLRQSIRRNMRYGGAMISLKYKIKKQPKPNIVVLCDVSASMSRFVRFTLPLLFGLSRAVKNIESFIFADDLEKATVYFHQGVDFNQATDNMLAKSPQMGQGTNLFIALNRLEQDYAQLLSSSTVLIVISDAHTLSPLEAAEQLRIVNRRVKQVLWLNPLPKERWEEINAIPLFRRSSQMMECYSLAHLIKILSLNLARHTN
ncbi:MAG TPA: VWA domain-containing protein [Patescibacteria group bacterium]|nr:VWA domain-containing protein [Patescibacteria group bacterium]